MKKKALRYFAVFMILNIVFEVIQPTVALALTNGPVQPEFTGFEPANSSEMVDLFTGDFKYNIPLMDVDGYPLNLSYHAGQNMESEASWVGLGWSLNPGALNRNVRGLPDDFNGEVQSSYTNIKPNTSMGVGYQFSAFIGASPDFHNIGVGAKISGNGAIVLTYNNYKGYGLEVELDGQNSIQKSIGFLSASATHGVGMKLSSQDGGTYSENYAGGVGVSCGIGGANAISVNASMGVGTSINTRTGAVLKSASQGLGVSASVGGSSFGVGFTVAHSLPVGGVAYAPSITNNYKGGGFSLSFKAGLWGTTKLFLNGFPITGNLITAGALFGFKGYYNYNQLDGKSRTIPSYGYLYSENAPDDALMDFNRFRDGAIYEETPNINLTVNDYDIFSASAQGMGAAFRPFRSDIGTYHDNVANTKAYNIPVETELAAGAVLHLLINTSKVNNVGKSGLWNTFINYSQKFTNKDITLAANRFYEKYYFKQMGEMGARDASFDGNMGGEAAVSPSLTKIGNDFHAFGTTSNKTTRDNRNTYIQSLTAEQASKYGFEPKITLYPKAGYTIDPASHLVMADASYSLMSRTTKSVSTVSTSVAHHLSEISLTNTSGSRYIYGIPSYNLYKKKVVFNASERVENPYNSGIWPATTYTNDPLPISHSYQMVEYDPAGGNEITDNYRGLDNFYREEITKPYATSYLLTNILSDDYVDVTGDGASYDDLGSFTKFNYYKDAEYGWREPYCIPAAVTSNGGSDWSSEKGNLATSKNQANYEKGLIADKYDDKAFYEYGIRENYYVHSIETKNYVAFFETSDRYDQLGVDDEHGTITSTPQNLKLDAVKLYAKNEIIAKGGIANAIPIKTVHFEYDYSLCPGTFNSQYNSTYNSTLGKLTLTKVYFSYGSSDKAALSPYKFTYGANFSYNPRAVDRWGMRMASSTYSTGNPNTLNNVEFPYAIQDKSIADANAAAWNITQIETPTGAKINIDYESDDYGYVQNEQAGQMLMIQDIVSSVNPLSSAPNTTNGNIKDADYLIVDMSRFYKGISATTYSNINNANSFVKRNVIKPGKDLYYKTFLKLGGTANSFGLKENYYEYVSGYGTVLDVGVFTSTVPGNTYSDGTSETCYKYLYIRLKKEIAYDSKDVNPITIAGWDYMRNFLPRVAYPGSEPANMGTSSHKPLKQFKNMVTGLGVAMADFVNGLGGKPNKRFYNKNFCSSLDYGKSFIRAYVPFKKKLGGGYRVKKIITQDEWSTMTSTQEASTSYGQVYSYTTLEGKDTISSGVALYEPLTGGDEISLRQPIDFNIIKQMAPNDHFFQEAPYGEMLYPAPLVGYSKVTVSTLADPTATVTPTVTNIGKIEYEFYTAKDFPILYQTTGLKNEPVEEDLIEDFIISPVVTKIYHAVQGHLLKFNDMHGKLKAVNNYGEDNFNAPLSGVKYFYKQSGRNLITSAPTINEQNQVATVPMSRDIDLATDTRENISQSVTMGNSFLLEIGLGINLIVIPPYVYAVVPWPYINEIHDEVIYGEQHIGVRTAATTKIVQQYGILDKVEAFDEKSKVSTENLLWDKRSGSVVLTRTTNNHDQPVYNFNYPAYWIYPQMSHEFKRDNIELVCPSASATTLWDVSTGTISVLGINTPVKLLAVGDEVAVREKASGTFVPGRFWVMTDAANPFGGYVLCDQTGNVLNSNPPHSISSSDDYIIKIIRPIERNNLTSSAGYITALANPVTTPSYTSQVINAGVQQFCVGSAFYLNPAMAQQSLTNVSPSYSNTAHNSITGGYYGTLRPSKTYNYNVSRSYGSQPNVKQDGVYNSFSPFWNYSFLWTGSVGSNWIVMNNNKYYSPYGQLLESEDALLLPHAQRFQFNQTLPALTANNARANEVGFDSFEDYDYSMYAAYTNTTQIYNNDYLGFYKYMSSGSTPPSTSTTTAHTGRTSLYFAANTKAVLTHNMYYNPPPPPHNADEFTMCNDYFFDCSKLNFNNANIPPKKYMLSFWVKGNTQALDYSSQPKVVIKATNVTTVTPIVNSYTPTPVKTEIINGWQKLDYEFSILQMAATTSSVVPSEIEFTISSSANAFFIDDFRVQPFNASMVCNVYDPYHLRLWAQLDDRNFATVMEYDKEGTLVRKKKETLKGLYTLNEMQKGNIKN